MLHLLVVGSCVVGGVSGGEERGGDIGGVYGGREGVEWMES